MLAVSSRRGSRRAEPIEAPRTGRWGTNYVPRRPAETVLHGIVRSDYAHGFLRLHGGRWRRDILAYWQTRATNGMTEGFNGKAKLVKRRAYGYRSFTNYRLRLFNACA